jgi:hypothetical protein
MKKTIRLRESDLVKIVKKVIAEQEVSEQGGFLGALKDIGNIRTAVKDMRAARGASQIAKELEVINNELHAYPEVSQTTKNLIAKTGNSIKLTPQIKSLLTPVQREFDIIMNDVKRLKNIKLQGPQGKFPTLLHLESHLEEISRIWTSNFPRFQPTWLIKDIDAAKKDVVELMNNPEFRNSIDKLKEISDGLNRLEKTFESTLVLFPMK